MYTRRAWILICSAPIVIASTSGIAALVPAKNPEDLTGDVWKSPTCGCCGLWVKHLIAQGFTLRVHDVADISQIKRERHVPTGLSSCHTAVIGGYVIEGHVPADVVRDLLKQRPDVVGVAVPGMPMGSPGMEGARKDRYSVMAFDKTGETRVFASR